MTAASDVTVDGVRLAYEDAGAGPPVVCLHAIGHDASDFASLRARLSSRHRVVALDWPGQGRSGADRTPASATRYERLLAGFLDALGIEKAVVVGNSIGGAAAIRFAAAEPGRVAALVLENPGGLAPTHDVGARVALHLFARFFAAGARGARWFPVAFAAYYRLVLRRPAAADARRRIVASAPRIAPVLAEAWRSFAAPDADIRDLAPRVACPVLFAWAVKDRIVELRRSRPAIARFGRAELVTFDAGHAAHLEEPARFADAVAAFLLRIGWTVEAGVDAPGWTPARAAP